jgi:hypothetical protein
VFEVKCNLPELRPSNAQNVVKIVSFIFPIIYDKPICEPMFFLDIPQESAPYCAEMFHLWRRERTTLQIGGVDGAGNRDTERAHISFAENAGVLSKVIDEHNVAVYTAFL